MSERCSCSRAALQPGASARCMESCATGSLRSPGLAVRRWPNGAFGGTHERRIVASLEQSSLRWPADEVFSAEVLGTLTLPPRETKDGRWIITCDAQGGSYYLWLDDHLVCEGGNGQPKWNPYRLEPVLPFNHTLAALRAVSSGGGSGGGSGHVGASDTAPAPPPSPVRYFLRATFIRLRQHVVSTPNTRPYIALHWQRCASMPSYAWGRNLWLPRGGSRAPPPEPVPRSALSTHVPTAQHARLTMQRELVTGYYGTWAERSASVHTFLPSGVEVRIGLCTLGGPSRRCVLESTKRMVDDGLVRLGVHATDHGYTQLFFGMRVGTRVDGSRRMGASTHGGDGDEGDGGEGEGEGANLLNVSIETAQRGRWGPLFIVARVVGGGSRALAVASQAALIISVGFAGAVEVAQRERAGATGSGAAGSGAFEGPPGWVVSGRIDVDSAVSSSRGAASPPAAIVASPDGQWRRQAVSELSDLPGVHVRGATGPNASSTERLPSLATPHLVLRLAPHCQWTAAAWASRFPRGQRTLSDVVAAVEGARRAAVGVHAPLGKAAAELAQVSQSAIMWNALSRASIPGPHVQCARGWGRPWVAFMWDDAFAAMQLGALGAHSLAYSQLATLLKVIHAQGRRGGVGEKRGQHTDPRSILTTPCTTPPARARHPLLAGSFHILHPPPRPSIPVAQAGTAFGWARAKHVDAELDLFRPLGTSGSGDDAALPPLKIR
jgi:hypothetical protein